MRCSILTVSTLGAQGLRVDESGEMIASYLQANGHDTIYREIVPDILLQVRAALLYMTDELQSDLVLTTGGTGLSPTDVTPEATLAVLDREIPGMAEALRLKGLAKTPRAMLTRGLCGSRGGALIINLPGSPKAVQEGLDALHEVLELAAGLVKGYSLD